MEVGDVVWAYDAPRPFYAVSHGMHETLCMVDTMVIPIRDTLYETHSVDRRATVHTIPPAWRLARTELNGANNFTARIVIVYMQN